MKNKRIPINRDLCVITFPTLNHVPLAILIQILEPLSDKITVITGNFPQNAINSAKVSITNIKHDRRTKQLMLIRVIKYLIVQLRISYHLINRGGNADIVLFFIGGTWLFLPMLVAKLLGKKAIQIIAGSAPKSAKEVYREHLFGLSGFVFSFIPTILEQCVYKLSTKIVVYSPSVIPELGLDKYSKKVIPNGAWFTDINLFQAKKKPSEKKNLIGYFGRLSYEKGVINFIESVPFILKSQNNVDFIVGGSGPLFNGIKKMLKNIQVQEKVALVKWIPHEKMPDYLNEVKLVVLPSYTEGLPNIVLEAMACCTPVLATPVGSVPEVIKDGETGFIMGNNSPKSIAENVMRALEHPNLDMIVKNARKVVEREYTYRVAVERYKRILEDIRSGNK